MKLREGKIRIFKKSDGLLFCQSYEDDNGDPIIPDTIEYSETHEIDSNFKDGVDYEAIYIENGEVKKDPSFDKILMPVHFIKTKRFKKVIQNLKKESESENTNTNKMAAYSAELNLLKAVKEDDELFYYKLAKKGLDERLADGEPDKTEIRSKLESKINELEGG